MMNSLTRPGEFNSGRITVCKMIPGLISVHLLFCSMGIRILGCRYMGRKCVIDWEQKYTRYGMCYSFNPDGNENNTDAVPEKVRVL